jgi:lipopolysaccharide transport system permease protein
MKEEQEEWTDVITPTSKWYQLNLREVYDYKDLLFLFVRRDFVSQFKQTILGPLWFVIQPVLQAFTMYFVFGKMAKIGTDGLPAFLFYLSGTILWSYFADCLNQNAKTFTGNANIFGKVYFPRLIIPISVVISNFFKLTIRLGLFILAYAYYAIFTDANLIVSPYIWVFIPLVILMAGYGLSLGVLFSSLTTKYRDFTFLLGFGVQLLMYTSAVIYPLSVVDESYRQYLRYNPFVNISETFKYITMGKGEFSPFWLVYSFVLLIVITIIALIIFKRTEKSFMDTV